MFENFEYIILDKLTKKLPALKCSLLKMCFLRRCFKMLLKVWGGDWDFLGKRWARSVLTHEP